MEGSAPDDERMSSPPHGGKQNGAPLIPPAKVRCEEDGATESVDEDELMETSQKEHLTAKGQRSGRREGRVQKTKEAGKGRRKTTAKGGKTD